MLEIIKQEEIYKTGNDCIQKNCLVIVKCHEKYLVVDIIRFTGWGDKGIEFEGKKEFDNLYNALNYYDEYLKKF